MPRQPREGLYRDKKTPYWLCRWLDADGKLQRKSTGKLDETEAKQVYQTLRGDTSQLANDVITVDAVLELYHDERGYKLKGNGYRYAVTQLKQFFTQIEWGRLGKKGDPKRINKYIEYRQSQGVKAGTINKEIMYLSAAANIAIDEGWEIKNHAAGKKLEEPQPQYYWLTPEQGRALLNACSHTATHKYATPSPHLVDYVIIALGTGMRTTEILSLRRRQIDLHRNLISLPTSKAGKSHEIPMSEDVQAAVKRCLGRSDTQWLFYNPCTKTRLKSIRLQLRSAYKRAGIPVTIKKEGIVGVRGYDTRHSCATWLLQAGASLEEIGDLLNHADPRTTKRYAHHGLKGRQATVNKLPKLK